MEAIPPTYLGHSPSPTPPTPPSFRFGGIGDAISKGINLLDSNRVVELTSTDVAGMCFPRIGIEAAMRPPGYRQDAAREATIREFSGLFFNTFSAGWANYAIIRLIGNRLNWYNPHGTPARAWINSESLEGFGKLYENILHNEAVKTPAQAREQFIRTILSSMASSDRNTHFMSMLTAAEGLDKNARFAFLKTAFSESPHYLGPLKKLLDQEPQNLVQHATELMPGNNGKLSTEVLEKLYQYLRPTNQEAVLGTHLFDQKAAERTQAFLLEDRKILQQLSKDDIGNIQKLPIAERYDALFKVLPEEAQHTAQKIFKKTRLQLSLGDIRSIEPELIRMMDRLAFSGDLTSSVQLLNQQLQPLLHNSAGKPIMMQQNRKTLLKEVKHFLEHYIDRAHYEARHSGEQWKNQVAETMYGKLDQPPGHFFSRWIAKAEDGLIPATLKCKGAYTYVPIFATIIASVAIAFYNNWLTQKKHGGRVISPIDGSSRGVIVPRNDAPSESNPNTPPTVSPPTPDAFSSTNTSMPHAPQMVTMSKTPNTPAGAPSAPFTTMPTSPFAAFQQPIHPTLVGGPIA